jgi:hypothetical protein
MPRYIKGIADDRLLRDLRLNIGEGDEARLLKQAQEAGIKDENIGTFYVVLGAEIPSEVTAEGYYLFSEDELREEVCKHDGWFYDEDKRRLVGTIPSVKEIASKMRTAKNEQVG